MTEAIPGRGQYTEDARRQRLAWLRKRTNTALESLENTRLHAPNLSGNLENFVGAIEVPVGLAGPLVFNGDAVRGEVVAPLATTEGALVASTSRGARAITASGGVTTQVLSQRMTRAPVLEFPDIPTAVRFTDWLDGQRAALHEQVALVSRHTKLVDIKPYQIGRYLHVQFAFETADAAGQNMTTTATWQICRWLTDTLTNKPDLCHRNLLLEGNLSGDKKLSAGSVLAGRGTRATAECRIPRDIVASVLKTTPEAMVRAHTATVLGAQQAGTVGYGINAANIVAALFLATGQDVACVHESGVSLFSLEMDGDNLVATLLLPNLVVGTVGGGTALPYQRDLLTSLGCAGPGGVRRFAEIVTGFALALDLSTAAAMVSGQFADAHQRLGRSRRVEWLQKGDLNETLLGSPVAEALGDPNLRVTHVAPGEKLHGDGIFSELGTLGERRKFTGLQPLGIDCTTGDGSSVSLDVVAKVKSRGEEIAAGIARMASLCGPEVSAAWQLYGGDIGFGDAHRRELAVYRRPESVLKDLLPKCYGLIEDDEREAYVVLMERLRDEGGVWSGERVDDVLRAIATAHGHWLGRDDDLLAEGWLYWVPEPAHLAKAQGLWEALVQHTAADQPELLSADDAQMLLDIVADADRWTQELYAVPRTLVHNDFNPRNILVQEDRIVVIDWELATVGVPQRDVAELLAFTLDPDATTEQVDAHLAVHREAMAAVSPHAAELVAGSDALHGYRLGLRELLMTRLPLYAAAHWQREFAFLPRVLATALHLWRLEEQRMGS